MRTKKLVRSRRRLKGGGRREHCEFVENLSARRDRVFRDGNREVRILIYYIIFHINRRAVERTIIALSKFRELGAKRSSQ